MKRTVRRILVIAAGLALGWYAAGFAPWLGIGTGTSLAAESTPTQSDQTAGAAHESSADEGAHAAQPRQAHATDVSEGGEQDAGQTAAKTIVPQYEFEIGWYRPVVAGALLLFLAALVFGYPALKLQPPPPPDPVDDHDNDDHAAHVAGGHNAHGAGAGGHDSGAHGHGSGGGHP